jgi:hypothetical protein
MSTQLVAAHSVFAADCYHCRHQLLLLPKPLLLLLKEMRVPCQHQTLASAAPAWCVPPAAAAAAAHQHVASQRQQQPQHLLWLLCQHRLLQVPQLLWMLCRHLLLLLLPALSSLQWLLRCLVAARHLQQQGQCITPV